jgi:hypothetical protein
MPCMLSKGCCFESALHPSTPVLDCLSSGMRVRMGIATGEMQPGSAPANSWIMDLAKGVVGGKGLLCSPSVRFKSVLGHIVCDLFLICRVNSSCNAHMEIRPLTVCLV